MDVVERIVLAKQSFIDQACLEPDSLFVTPSEMEEIKAAIPEAEHERVLGLRIYQFDGIPEMYCERLGVWMAPIQPASLSSDRFSSSSIP